MDKQESERPLLAFIDEACSLDEAGLTSILNANLKWERPRGDLITWIKLLNHIDEIFEKKIAHYGLDSTYPKLMVMSQADSSVLTACLNFTNTLLEHCLNRNIYGSSERVYQLIKTPTIDVRLAALEVAVRLGERYVNSTYVKKYCAPKETRQFVLDMAKSFPPSVPTGFIQKQVDTNDQSSDAKSRSEHYSLVDTLDQRRVYPSKWSSLSFHYYTSPQVQQVDARQDSKKDKKQHKKSTQTEKEGLNTFSLCESSIRKLSFEQVYDKATEVLPKTTWFNFSLAVHNAKAFNSRSDECMKLREKLIQIKCASVAFTALMCSAEFTSSNLFEAEPYLLSFLVDFMSPEHSPYVPPDVYLGAIKALEAIAHRRQWGGDLIRNMGGNVSHGLLYQQLRRMNKQIKDESDACIEKANLLVFTLISHFIDNKSLIPRLASGGILNELMTFLNMRTKYRWSCSAAVNTIALLLRSSPEYISDFINLDGFRLLIETINHEVDFALDNPDFAGGPPRDAVVYYNISIRQVNYLRNLLRLCSQLVQADGSDRMRNLFDSSILTTFKKVIENPTLFGPPVLGATLDAVLYIVHNEPTAFSILNEAGVIDSVLNNYQTLFMPSNELQMALLEVLGAISLNKEGLKRVIETQVLDIYYRSFYDIKIAKELVRGDVSTSIGVSMDELGRHFPDLKPVILGEIKKLIKGMSSYAGQYLKPIRFYPRINHGVFYASDESNSLEVQEGEDEIESWESMEGSTLIDNVFGFLGGLLQDSGQWVKDITEDVPFADWAAYITLPNSPIDYVTSNGMTSLMNLLKFLEDEQQNYGFPSLFRILPQYLSSPLVQGFINSDTSDSYFAELQNEPGDASKLLQELNAINNILLILCESYLLPNNMVNEKFQSLINILEETSYPVVNNLIKLMGRSIIEEATIRTPLLAEAVELTAPVIEPVENVPPYQIFGRKPKNEPTNVTWTDTRFKNTLQLRFLSYRFQHNIALILSDISRSCMQKRQDFFSFEWRRKAVIQTKKLAAELECLFERGQRLNAVLVPSYRLISTNLIAFISHSKDKGRDVFSTALALCFFYHTELMEKITSLAIHTFQEVICEPIDERLDVQSLDFIGNSRLSIQNNFISEALSFLVKMTEDKYVPRIPSSHLFFHKEYCALDAEIPDGITSKAAELTLKVVQETVGTSSPLSREENEDVYSYFPLSVNLKLVDAVIATWRVDPVDYYYELHEDYGTPPYDYLRYLMQSLDISQERAIKLLKYMRRDHSPESAEDEEVPSAEESTALETLRKDVHFMHRPRDTDSKGVILMGRETEGRFLFGLPLIKLASFVEQLENKVAVLIEENDLISLANPIVDYIESLQTYKEDWSFKRRALSLNLLRRLYTTSVFFGEESTGRKSAFLRFSRIFISSMQDDPEIANEPYFKSALSFLQPAMSCTPPNTLPGLFPFFDDDGSSFKDELLEVLLSLKPKGDIGCSLAICRMLYLYASQDKYKAVITSSAILRTIFESIRNSSESLSDDLKELQKAAILLVRVCFEDSNTLENVFSSEIVKAFKRQPNGKKEFRRLLEESIELVSRDPSTYINVASKLVRLENYDGEAHHGETLFLADYDEVAESDADVEMKDSENVTGPGSGGLMHFLLVELMACSKSDWTSTPSKEQDVISSAGQKKEPQIDFLMKNSNFAYLCFLLQIVTELLGSYKQAKLEFITFSKKEGFEDRNRPRSTSLNFFIHQLNPSKSLDNIGDDESQRREAISSLSKLCLLSLVSTPVLKDDASPSPKSEDVDLAIVRRFVMDIISKVIKDSLTMRVSSVSAYGKLYDVFDLCSCLLSAKFREMCFPLLSKSATRLDQFFIAVAFIERQLPNQLASAIADVDLNYPSVTRLIKVGIKPLSHLSKIKLTYGEYFETNHSEKDEEDILPDDVVDRDETPDLFRNSTLGMYDANSESEDEFYDEGDPLEVVMSGSDISQDDDEEDDEDDDVDDSDDSSEMDDVMDDEHMDDEMMEHGAFEGYDSGDSEGDIEIIDELDIGSHSGDSERDASDISEFYGFDEDEYDQGEFIEEDDDDDEIEYDDAELDGWLDTFGHHGESDEEDSGNPRFGSMFPVENHEDDSAIDIRSEEEENDGSDGESTFESDIEEIGGHEPNSATREFMTSIFDVLRPALRQQNVSNIFEGLVNGRLRSSFRVSGHRGNDSMLPGFDRAFEVILNDKPNSAQKGSLNHVYIRSTVERWSDAHAIFYGHGESELVEEVRTQITKKIHDESLEIFTKLNEERERIKQEREEKAKKRREEIRLKREEEQKQRDLERQHNPQVDREPVMLRIGDREVDISGTDIDPEFFEALPDDMREEVFTQHIRERRANANNTGAEVREIDPDFLDALPDQIREEILQQEAMARRFSSGRLGFLEADEDDDSEIEEDEDEETERHDPIVMNSGVAIYPPGRRANNQGNGSLPKKHKTFSTPLIDKAAVASLARLLFIPQPFHQRSHIYSTLSQLCNNKQTRAEVMSLLIAILNDALHSQKALEKLFYVICGRASNKKSQDESTKKSFPVGATPVVVGIQLIEAVFFLLDKNVHSRYYLLTEHENIFVTRRVQKKKLQSLSSEDKYPINFLLKLLENPLLREQHMFIDLLASVLHVGTRPLLLLKESNKQHPPISTTSIPESNLRLIVHILCSNECANTTFRRTISAMQNLSIMKNAQDVFSSELSQEATKLSHDIVTDLKSLSMELESGMVSSTESKHLGKFTAPSSDQAKLLRILTALDYMYENSTEKEAKQKDTKTVELTNLYEKLGLGKLWGALSVCLRVLENAPSLLNIATALLPLIEALMVVCKHSKVKDLQMKDVVKYEAKKIDFTKEPIESLFFSFTDEHKKILNQMVRTNPNLMSGPFSMLVRNPRVLEFDNKKNYFDRQLHEKAAGGQKLSISIRRDQVFLDSYRALFFKSVDEFRKAKLEINFKGESGIDAGGVTREWYQVLSRQMFNPDYALFSAIASDETTFHPNRTSYVNPEHLSFFKFIGRIIGKAIFDGSFLDCHFSRAVYKKILDRPMSLKDMETLDLEYFKSLMWMLDNDITDILTEDFSVESDDYGEHKIIDLVPNGRNIPVTEENKQDYVRLVVEYRLQKSVEEQMSNFSVGFHEIIPKELVGIFDEQELELLISGLPDIEVGDWQANTTYNNYSPSSEQIQWFWRAVKSFDNEERAKLLQFATGTSKVPLNGFKELRGANGTCKFSIHRDYGSTDRLPSSHTCFNQIDLPAYESYETLRGSILLAITEGHEGFGMA